MKSSAFAEQYLGVGSRMWGEDHDLHFRWFLVVSVKYEIIGVLIRGVKEPSRVKLELDSIKKLETQFLLDQAQLFRTRARFDGKLRLLKLDSRENLKYLSSTR